MPITRTDLTIKDLLYYQASADLAKHQAIVQQYVNQSCTAIARIIEMKAQEAIDHPTKSSREIIISYHALED